MLSHLARCDVTVKAASTVLHTLCPVNNGGPTGSGDSVVVSLPEPSDSTDACLSKEMHGKVTQALLSDHHVRFVLDDLCADLLDVVFLHFQQRSPANACVPRHASCSSNIGACHWLHKNQAWLFFSWPTVPRAPQLGQCRSSYAFQ